MAAYERFAAFYDEVMDDPDERAALVAAMVARHHPDATSLLELGCGTGSLLARLESPAELVGLDRSPEMLAVAAAKVPGARLLEGDMAAFALGRRFDVVACIFDSLNHLTDLASWDALLGCVHAHLAKGGLFVCDINTVGELRRLGDDPPWVHDFDRGTAIIDVAFAADDRGLGHSEWDIRIFEHVAGGRYELHREVIGELGVPLAAFRALAADRFVLLEEVDQDGLAATDDSVKAHYAFRQRG
jgi:SAM-dependent methyltransferase